ncbi:MAG TPA: hypothetical protein VKE70_10280 [Candidatus Solibacter sp.]|nr:hypothetical protein [Candidatus Solibacter sp.]
MCHRSILFLLPVLAAAQALPTRLDPISLIAPATNIDGSVTVFAAAMDADAKPLKAANLFVSTDSTLRQLTNFTSDVAPAGVSSLALNGGKCAYVASFIPSNAEEIHLIDPTTAADRTIATDKEGCIQPLCIGCFRSCISSVHVTSDAGKVLYAAARQQPFYVVNADGSGIKQLPVYQGVLAPSSRRVIAGNTLVFTTSAPSGPTFAAAATDIYTINLDGTGLRQVTKFGNPLFFAGSATISADGAWIAFESNYGTSGPQTISQIWVVRADGTDLRQLSGGTNSANSPSIAADGSIVTYLQGGQIMRVATDASTAPVALTQFSTSAPRDPALSDDGAWVLFTVGPPSGTSAGVRRTPTQFVGRAFQPVLFAPRFLNANGIVSAAGTGSATPGSLLTAYGANLGSGEMAQASAFPLPTSLNELSLLVNGRAIPLTAVTPWQINAQLPQTVAPGVAALQVRDPAGNTLSSVSASVEAADPVNFTYPFVRDRLAYQQAAAFHAGTGIPADMDHPLAAGETVEIYCVGLGVTDPAVDAGVASPANPLARAVQTPKLLIGGRDATVTFAGLVPGFAGLYQVNAVVPTGLAAGIQSIAWRGPNGTLSYSAVAVR